MQKRLTWMSLMLVALIAFVGCSDDDPVAVTPPTNFEVMADAVEAYLPVLGSSYIVASDVNTGVNADPPTLQVFDIRGVANYDDGHVKGAINTTMSNIVTAVQDAGMGMDDTIVVACYTGQSAGHAVTALRLLGYDNARTLKFGMSSWSPDVTGGKWIEPANPGETSGSCKDDLLPANLEVTANTLTTEYAYPTGQLAFEEQVIATLASFEAVTMGTINTDDNLGSYFWLNYVPEADYMPGGVAPGHVAGAFQFAPGTSIDRDTLMKYLPSDGTTIAVYCYTGQSSSQVTFALNALGYEAKSMKYGMNHLFYNDAAYTAGSKWVDTMCGSYDLYDDGGLME